MSEKTAQQPPIGPELARLLLNDFLGWYSDQQALFGPSDVDEYIHEGRKPFSEISAMGENRIREALCKELGIDLEAWNEATAAEETIGALHGYAHKLHTDAAEKWEQGDIPAARKLDLLAWEATCATQTPGDLHIRAVEAIAAGNEEDSINAARFHRQIATRHEEAVFGVAETGQRLARKATGEAKAAVVAVLSGNRDEALHHLEASKRALREALEQVLAAEEDFKTCFNSEPPERALLRGLICATAEEYGFVDTESQRFWETEYEPGISRNDVIRATWKRAKEYLLKLEAKPEEPCCMVVDGEHEEDCPNRKEETDGSE